MLNRNVRQVKDRYNNYLHLSISNKPWSIEEDQKLVQLIQQYGKKWKKISECFDGRNEVNVKNRWNYTLTKQYSTEIESDEQTKTKVEENQKQNVNFDLTNNYFTIEDELDFYWYSIKSDELDNLVF
jgi:myb proto-oncogene protein